MRLMNQKIKSLNGADRQNNTLDGADRAVEHFLNPVFPPPSPIVQDILTVLITRALLLYRYAYKYFLNRIVQSDLKALVG